MNTLRNTIGLAVLSLVVACGASAVEPSEPQGDTESADKKTASKDDTATHESLAGKRGEDGAPGTSIGTGRVDDATKAASALQACILGCNSDLDCIAGCLSVGGGAGADLPDFGDGLPDFGAGLPDFGDDDDDGAGGAGAPGKGGDASCCVKGVRWVCHATGTAGASCNATQSPPGANCETAGGC